MVCLYTAKRHAKHRLILVACVSALLALGILAILFEHPQKSRF